MEYYLIKHLASGEFMPQMKRGRGYTHWNPSSAVEASNKTNVPRLLVSEEQAKRVIKMWAIYPNAHTRRAEADWDNDDFLTKPDGRKREDLVVVKVQMVEIAITAPLTIEEVALVHSYQRIRAIKTYKDRTGLSLKESIDAIRAVE